MHLRPLRLETADVSAAESLLRGSLVGVESLEFGPDLSLDISGVRGDDFSVMRLTHSSVARLITGPPGNLHVLEVLRGSARLGVRGVETTLRPGQVIAIDSGSRVRLASDRLSVGIVTLSRDLLAAAADEPSATISFPDHSPLSADWPEQWRGAVRRLNREVLGRSEARGEPRVVADLVSALAVSALAGFAHELQDRHREPGPSAVRRATAFIDQNADQPMTVAEIARAAHTSVRALQQAFARHHDSSPTAYLRQVRLERAHRELLQADPDDGVTVAEVAARWGFAQPGRFAAHYREAYGRLPSDSLRAQPM
ncbi:AraC family transcriptional regulator [Nocardioides houyundeii]|uniref:AraC family transcriptional regulator n=1 Tax=Nocardioides houyundeii TaxID=2045452 RepID=UPI000C75D242|nr:helix-turn-helix domain-containing protein [Nocardioides houyundeii]